MEKEKVEEQKYYHSFKAAEVSREKITFFGYKELNFFGTTKERMAIEKEALKTAYSYYFKSISKIKYSRLFNTATVTIYHLDPKEKTIKLKYDVKGKRLGTNLGSVLLNLAVDTANTGIELYHASNPEQEEKK